MGFGSRKSGASLAFILLSYLFLSQFCTAIDTLTQNQSISESQTLTSAGGTFELGFFRPGNSGRIYVGIWYKRISRRVVWVANREDPLTDSSGNLTISDNGNLVILDGNSNIIWTTNYTTISSSPSSSVVAVLLDSGNLVLKENNTSSSQTQEKFLWESFDYPSDTFLPAMKIGFGFNAKTGDQRFLTSWNNEGDPSPGNYLAGLKQQNPVQIFIWDIQDGTVPIPYYRSGQWNGSHFIGLDGLNDYFSILLMNNSSNNQEGTTYLTFSLLNHSMMSFFVINPSGGLRLMIWQEVQKEWIVRWESQRSRCQIYGFCGPNSSCDESYSQTICKCFRGFQPKLPDQWIEGNMSGGCVRRTQLPYCNRNSTNLFSEEEGFLVLRGLQPPDLSETVEEIANVSRCEIECRKNCSCMAYAHVSGIGCMIWSGDLMDVRMVSGAGTALNIRLPYSELIRSNTRLKLLRLLLGVGFGTFTLCILGYMLWKRANQIGTLMERLRRVLVDLVKTKDTREDSPNANIFEDGVYEGGETHELNIFDLASIAMATNNFCLTNKLGEGGFGPVYKGKLQNGQEIAAKRLSESSGQGIQEFKNEVILISKLQHRNLVKLLGCCIGGEENILVYEYMPNKSLDAFIFDPRKRAQLDWGKRFNIIEGIARGLLYLHRDSRLRVIHRDLKVSNISLDEDLNPKISDFGMARIFGGTQTMANTKRVVGTFGYMSPEYIMGGTFSEKSDVFSFGVLILEIVTSKRNSSFYNPEQSVNLLIHTWRLWNEGKWSEIVDDTLGESYSQLEVRRCIHIGLLCVQRRAIDRPTMSTVDLILNSDTNLPPPKEPPFTSEISSDSDFLQVVGSNNNVTITNLEGR